MGKLSPNVCASEPKSVFTKPLKADWKGLFKALSKGIAHASTGKWEELGTDTVEALSAIGVCCEPGELAFLLIQRSIIKAVFELVGGKGVRSSFDSCLRELQSNYLSGTLSMSGTA